jgi:hypothetical protein
MAKKRIVFDLKARIRDHDGCSCFEPCLTAAARLNAPRVCNERCPLWIPPHPRNAMRIAEAIDWFREQFDMAQRTKRIEVRVEEEDEDELIEEEEEDG